MMKVQKLTDLFSLKVPDNAIIYVEDKEGFFQKTPEGWEKTQIKGTTNSNIQMSLYDMNRSLIEQLGPLNKNIYSEKINLINQYRYDTNNIAYMLYGKEISYFTVFVDNDIPNINVTLGETIFQCLENVGEIYSIELTENKDAIEFWVKTNEQITCLYLFPYDSAFVEYH